MISIRSLCLGIALTTSIPCIAQEPVARPNLKGTVADENGKPIEGATVYIWTAGVKKGYSTFCPSCYADCGKFSETNAQGEFEITSLDPDLKFELMVAKNGLPPTSKGGVDPAAAESVSIKVPKAPPLPTDANQTISGIVTDLDGTPVANAMVSPEMILWDAAPGESTGAGGSVDGLDEFTITDKQGRFTLAYSKRPVKTWQLRVDARGFAGALFKYQTSESAARGLKIGPGAIVQGRLLHDGKPVPGAELTLAHAANTGGFYLGRQRIGTDAEGRFLFAGVPIAQFDNDPEAQFAQQTGPLDGWWITPTIDSVHALGAASPKLVHASQHGQVIDVGDIELGPGLHIKGRVVCADGKPVPEGSQIFVDSATGWEATRRPIGPDGAFVIDGLHAGDWTLDTSIRGYNISPINPSALKGFDCLQGNLDKDVDDLTIVVDANTPRRYMRMGPPFAPFVSIDATKLAELTRSSPSTK